MGDLSHTRPAAVKARIRPAAQTAEIIEHLTPECVSGYAAGG